MTSEVTPGGKQRKEIYTYTASWQTHSFNLSNRADPKHEFRLALGSYIEDYANRIHIVELKEETDELVKVGAFDHHYPATRIQWAPKGRTSTHDMLATTGDYLRLWNIKDRSEDALAASTDGFTVDVQLEKMLNPSKGSEYCAPLTSFDWNQTDPSMIITSSIDTTCALWDLETQKVVTQLIAHDKEVLDVAFSKGKDIFGTVGADGSLRTFDLRSLEHSTIVYEVEPAKPLIQMSWNKMDENYIAVLEMDATAATVIDIRMPQRPVCQLAAHEASVNCVQWAPHSSCHLCTGAEDSQALIWDISCVPRPVEDPILAYSAEGEISQLQWPSSYKEWVAITYNNSLQILRV